MADDESPASGKGKGPLLTASASRDPRVASLPEDLRDRALAREAFSLYLAPGKIALLMVPAALIGLGLMYRYGFWHSAPIAGIIVAALVVVIGAVLDRRIDVDVDGLTFVPLVPIRPRQRFPYSALRPFEHWDPTSYGPSGGDKQRAVITDPAYAYKTVGIFRRDKLETAAFYGLSYRGAALDEDQLIACLDIYHPRATGSLVEEAFAPVDIDRARAALGTLDGLVSRAHGLREPNTVGVPERIIDVVPAVASQARALGAALQIYRAQRAKDGDPQLGDAPADGFREPVEDLESLVRPALMAWEGMAKILDGARLAASAAALHAWMEPSLTELEEYRRRDPGVSEQPPEPEEQPEPEPEEPSELLDAAEALLDLVREAEPVLLKPSQIRIEPARVTALTSLIRAAAPGEFDEPAGIVAKADEIDAFVGHGRSIPLSSEVRVDYDGMFDLAFGVFEACIDALGREKPAEGTPDRG